MPARGMNIRSFEVLIMFLSGKTFLFGSLVSIVGCWTGFAFAQADCDEPRYLSIRRAEMAQHDRLVGLLTRNKDCSLIATILANRQRANGRIGSALAAARCTAEEPNTSVAQLQQALRTLCGGENSAARS